MSGMLGGRDRDSRSRGSAVEGLGGRRVRIGVGEVGLVDRLKSEDRARGIRRVISIRDSSVSCSVSINFHHVPFLRRCQQQSTHLSTEDAARAAIRAWSRSQHDIMHSLQSIGRSDRQLMVSTLPHTSLGVAVPSSLVYHI